MAEWTVTLPTVEAEDGEPIHEQVREAERRNEGPASLSTGEE
jgi:hypothetical protein